MVSVVQRLLLLYRLCQLCKDHGCYTRIPEHLQIHISVRILEFTFLCAEEKEEEKKIFFIFLFFFYHFTVVDEEAHFVSLFKLLLVMTSVLLSIKHSCSVFFRADIGAFVRLSLSVCVPLFLHLLACSPDSPPTADKAER